MSARPTRTNPVDLEPSVTMQVAFPDHANKGYTKLAFCIALYLVLALIWMPGFDFGDPVYTAAGEDSAPMRRKVLRPPPEKPIETVTRKTKKAKKVPMPDTTPDEPEPLIAYSPIAAPSTVETDDWEIGIPNGPPANGSGESVAAVGDAGVDPPIFTKKVPPRYPEAGVQVRLQGYVILQAILRKTGIVDDIQVLRGLGRGKFGFEEEAIASLQKWEFLPGKVNGEPADVRMNLRVDFIIH